MSNIRKISRESGLLIFKKAALVDSFFDELASYFTQEGPTEDKDYEFLDDDKVDDILQENELPDSNNYNETPDVNDHIENLQSKPRKKIKPGYFEHFEQKKPFPVPYELPKFGVSEEDLASGGLSLHARKDIIYCLYMQLKSIFVDKIPQHLWHVLPMFFKSKYPNCKDDTPFGYVSFF